MPEINASHAAEITLDEQIDALIAQLETTDNGGFTLDEQSEADALALDLSLSFAA